MPIRLSSFAVANRVPVAVFVGALATGATCGTTPHWAINLGMGLAIGIPVGFLIFQSPIHRDNHCKINGHDGRTDL